MEEVGEEGRKKQGSTWLQQELLELNFGSRTAALTPPAMQVW